MADERLVPLTRMATGRPVHHAYVFDREAARIVEHCEHRHRKHHAATVCAEAMTRRARAAAEGETHG